MKTKQEKPQSERFIDTARELGVDETGEGFEKAFGKIVPPRQPKGPNTPNIRGPKKTAE